MNHNLYINIIRCFLCMSIKREVFAQINTLDLKEAESKTSICQCVAEIGSKNCLTSYKTTKLFLLQNSSMIPADLFEKYQDAKSSDETKITKDHVESFCSEYKLVGRRTCNMEPDANLIIVSTGSINQLFIQGSGGNGEIFVCEGGISSPLKYLKMKDLGNVSFSKGAIEMGSDRTLFFEFNQIKGDILFPTGLSNHIPDNPKVNFGKNGLTGSSRGGEESYDIIMQFNNVTNVDFKNRAIIVKSAAINVNGAKRFVVSPGAFRTSTNNAGSGFSAKNVNKLELSNTFGSFVTVSACNMVELFHESVQRSVSLLSLSEISSVNLHKGAIMSHENLVVTFDDIGTLYYSNSISFQEEVSSSITSGDSKSIHSNSMSAFTVEDTVFQVYNRENQSYLLSKDIHLSNVTFKKSRFHPAILTLVASDINVEKGSPQMPEWVNLCQMADNLCGISGNKSDFRCPAGYKIVSNRSDENSEEISCNKSYFLSSGLWLNVFYAFVALAIIASLAFLATAIGIGVQHRKLTSTWKPETYELNSTIATLIADEERFMKYSEILHICGGEEHVVTTLPRPTRKQDSSIHPNPISKRSLSTSQLPETNVEYETGITLLGVRNTLVAGMSETTISIEAD